RHARRCAGRIVNPDGAPPDPKCRNERSTVGRHGQTLFFGRSGGNLLGRTVGEPLAPEMGSSADGRGEVHLLPIRRPPSGGARASRADLASQGSAISGNQTAGKTKSVRLVHLDRENPLPVRRGIGEMGHSQFMWRKVDVAKV